MRSVIGPFALVCALAACSSDDDGVLAGASTTVAEATTAPSSTASTASAASTSSSSAAPTTTTTTLARSHVDPIVAVTEDGRVVTLKANYGSELTLLGTVAMEGLGVAGGIGVSQADGVAYYSEPHEQFGRIWSVPTVGGSPLLVAAGSYPAIDDDGVKLAFVRAPNTVVLLDATTGAETAEITWAADDLDFFNVGGTITRLEWSPDSNSLAFQTNYDGSRTYVFRPGEHATLIDAELIADGLESPTWSGPDLIMGVQRCCYPEFETQTLEIYRVGGPDPALTIERAVTVVDWRTNTDRSAEINMQPGSRAGTITLRNAAGRPAWTTDGNYIAVSV